MTEARKWCQSRARWLLLLLAPLALAPLQAAPDLASAINNARTQACGLGMPLRENPRVNEVARFVAGGSTLEAAESRAGYRATSALSVKLSGVSDERSIERLMGRLCPQVSRPELRELGTYRYGRDLWIVLGEPFVPPDPRDAATIARRVLDLTNQARSQARFCGATWLPAAPPLSLDPTLAEAAVQHAQDMARHAYLDHTARDGSTPADRVRRVGYPWRLVGENLASGVVTADEAVAGWLGSPHHCENLMGAGFREMGVAFAVNLQAEGGVYWTQLFAARRARAAQ
jgi:uncharacterized protein YkwD